MRDEVIDAIDRADADDEVRAVIFTGAGRAYCAGADLSAGAKTFDHAARDDRPPEGGSHRDGGGLVSLRLYNCNKPLIAAVNGPAAGVGVTMTLPMDIRLASESARFGLVFSRRGVVPEACSSWFLPRVVGISQALEWVYSGRVFPAAEALKGGLVSEVLPASELLPRARAIAREIVENTSQVSVALCRHMLWRMLGADHPDGGPQDRFQGHPRHGRPARRLRRGRQISRKAAAGVPHAGLERHAGLFPLVGRTRI